MIIYLFIKSFPFSNFLTCVLFGGLTPCRLCGLIIRFAADNLTIAFSHSFESSLKFKFYVPSFVILFTYISTRELMILRPLLLQTLV